MIETILGMNFSSVYDLDQKKDFTKGARQVPAPIKFMLFHLE
jgi:hypothetical protein